MTLSELIMKLEDLEKIGFGNAEVFNQFSGGMGIGITKITTRDSSLDPFKTASSKGATFLEKAVFLE